MRELSLKEAKTVELKILLRVNEFCKKNNLRYFLAYGTLIGAVRHNGFIPWDADIDIIRQGCENNSNNSYHIKGVKKIWVETKRLTQMSLSLNALNNF